MKAIEVQNLSKKYISKNGDKAALTDFNMVVEKGSIFGLLGPNGAGKSTLINILSGTVTKSSGKAYIMGIDIDEQPKFAKTKIGIVPQEVALDTFFPVAEALEFYAGYFGIRRENRKTGEILDALGLREKANATSRMLSGGMKRRFLVAKAMVHSPDVLILDEPTAGVDIELRDQLWSYVKKLNNNGTTIILTTHYLEEAEKLCDKIAFINNGKLLKCDSKENLLSNLSFKELIIRTSNTLWQAPEIKGYQAELISSHEFKIKYNKNETKLGNLLQDIQNAGVDLVDLRVNEGNLEDVFRSIYSSSS